jgi:hypothetical protein
MMHTNMGERVGKPDNDEAEICALCKLGTFIRERTKLSIRQSTDKGYVQCLVSVSIAVCNNCGFRTLLEPDERRIENAIAIEYARLLQVRRHA